MAFTMVYNLFSGFCFPLCDFFFGVFFVVIDDYIGTEDCRQLTILP